jgi:hypothetical protein
VPCDLIEQRRNQASVNAPAVRRKGRPQANAARNRAPALLVL